MIDINEFIKNEEVAYYKIKSVRSVLFLHQEIFFDKKGFEHLIRKGKHRRRVKDQIRRLKLLKYVTETLQDYKATLTYRCFEKENTVTHLWGTTSIIQGQKIKVIIRKINNGRLVFLSIMNNK